MTPKLRFELPVFQVICLLRAAVISGRIAFILLVSRHYSALLSVCKSRSFRKFPTVEAAPSPLCCVLTFGYLDALSSARLGHVLCAKFFIPSDMSRKTGSSENLPRSKKSGQKYYS